MASALQLRTVAAEAASELETECQQAPAHCDNPFDEGQAEVDYDGIDWGTRFHDIPIKQTNVKTGAERILVQCNYTNLGSVQERWQSGEAIS